MKYIKFNFLHMKSKVYILQKEQSAEKVELKNFQATNHCVIKINLMTFIRRQKSKTIMGLFKEGTFSNLRFLTKQLCYTF